MFFDFHDLQFEERAWGRNRNYRYGREKNSLHGRERVSLHGEEIMREWDRKQNDIFVLKNLYCVPFMCILTFKFDGKNKKKNIWWYKWEKKIKNINCNII